MRILDRYVFREVVGPVLFGVAAFASLFIGSDLVSLAQTSVKTGAPLLAVLKLLAFKLPQIVVWTLPMSVLMATLLSLSRMSGTNEIVAMRAGGISFYRLAAPAIVVGLLISGVGLGFNELLVPAANQASQRVMTEEIKGGKLPRVTKNVVIQNYADGKLSQFLYATDFDQKTKVMSNVAMVDLSGGKPVRQTTAKKMVWEDDGWYFVDGTVYLFEGRPGSAASQVSQLTFSDGKQRSPITARPEDVARLQKDPEDMSLSELGRQLSLLTVDNKKRRELEVQYYLKYAVPAASVFFAWVGAPLGVQHHRRATSVGFGLSLIVVFVYYVILTLGTALGQGGTLPPIVAAWLANAVLGLAGLYLVLRARK